MGISRSDASKRSPSAASYIQIVAFAVALFACAPPREPDEIDAEYDQRQKDVVASHEQELYWPVCEVPPRAGKGCGLVADRLLRAEFLEKFIEKHCNGEDGPDCLAKFRKAFLRMIAKRYTLSRPGDVEAHCSSVTAQCGNLWYVELQYVKSHNAAVFEKLDRALAELSHERDRMHAEATDARRRRQALANAFASMGAAMQAPKDQRSSGCTSDYACPFGDVCAKDSHAMTGVCARAVNQYGTPTYSPPSPNSHGPGTGACMFDTECTPGFRCVKTAGGLRGNCMK